MMYRYQISILDMPHLRSGMHFDSLGGLLRHLEGNAKQRGDYGQAMVIVERQLHTAGLSGLVQGLLKRSV